MLSKKYYNAIAYHLALVEPTGEVPAAHEAWTHCCRAMADCLADDNPAFARSRFLEACKYSYWKGRSIPS